MARQLIPISITLPPELIQQLKAWAKDERRSFSGQITVICQKALKQRPPE